ncbi:MAG: DUF4276 family protein [Proteobacteria bacterium]|nr:DUF4276 family protein [Pseudomonadota bacterium]
MDEIRYTLISDGSSDRALLPILTWVLREKGEVRRVQPEWADLRRLPHPPQRLRERILYAIDLFPCDLLFVHRDAEREDSETRYREIRNALQEATKRGFQVPTVCVVPVRMTEAWLLFDEPAIRFAAGNPNGKNPLNMAELSVIEQIPNPKDVLFEILREASGLTGRRLKRFNTDECRIRITGLVSDFSPLRQLSAFQRLENDISTLKQNGWVLDIGSETA